MVGIGGSGMAALASLLLRMGKQVSGSDSSSSAVLDQLRAAGAVIFNDHQTSNVGDAAYLIRSSAVGADNPEVAEAARRGVPTRKLAEAVGELLEGRSVIAVAGTHGKTTTTALVTWLLDQGGVDPLGLIGADTPTYPLGARLGDGPGVIEADEYDRRFLNYWPELAIVTSVEADHLDYYRDLDEIRGAFQEMVNRLPEHGRLVVCADDACAASLVATARRETYGFAGDANWRLGEFEPVAGGGARFTLTVGGRAWAVASPLAGEHNARNVAGAIAAADHYGVGLRVALAALPAFRSPRRRFETRGMPRGVRVVDDYGHHPTEVAAVLRAAQASAEGEVWVVFQPHTTNRTAALFDQFAASFADADHALILPIYRPSGRETDAREVTSADLASAIQRHRHRDARVVESFDEAVEVVIGGARPGDSVVTMGAGDVTLLADRLIEALAT